MRHEHDHAEPKPVLQHPSIEEQTAIVRHDHAGYDAVYVKQCHGEQGGKGCSQLEAVQRVEILKSVADELVSELEPLDADSKRRTVEFGGGAGRTAGHQHRRITVDDDRL